MAEASSSVVGLSRSSLNLSRIQRASAIASAKRGSSGQASLTISSFVRPFFSFFNALRAIWRPERSPAHLLLRLQFFFFSPSLRHPRGPPPPSSPPRHSPFRTHARYLNLSFCRRNRPRGMVRDLAVVPSLQPLQNNSEQNNS